MLVGSKKVFFSFLILVSIFSFDALSSQTIHFHWTYQGTPYSLDWEESQNEECLHAYQSASHEWDRHISYITEDPCRRAVERLARFLESQYASKLPRTLDRLNFLLNFVRSIPYSHDLESKGADDYARYPYETLLDFTGDCEDFALLYSALLRYWCVNSVILNLPGHAATAVQQKFVGETRSMKTYFLDGEVYAFTETTGCTGGPCRESRIGQVIPLEHPDPHQYELESFDPVPLKCRDETSRSVIVH